MTTKDKSRTEGLVATLAVHGLLLLLLLLVVMTAPAKSEEGGVEVVMGNSELSHNERFTLTDVNVQQTPAVPQSQNPTPAKEEPMITQETEETVAIPSAEEEARKKEEADKIAERERIEREKKLEEERLAKETNDKIAGAFGKGRQMNDAGSSADEGSGVEGVPDGVAPVGDVSGKGGVQGTYDLSGRSIGRDGLPHPHYNVQDEGRVVITITVDPSGRVISAQKNPRTNTTNLSLIKAAQEAALKARFNTVNMVDNQMGTITYYFKLK